MIKLQVIIVFQADAYILNMIDEDWKKTGRCDFAMAKEKFMLAFASGFLMKKNSPYTEYFNRGYITIIVTITQFTQICVIYLIF